MRNCIEVRYRFVLAEGRDLSDPKGVVALIPLGKLKVDEYHVNYAKSALERLHFSDNFKPQNPFEESMVQEIKAREYKPINRDDARKIVCNPFSFTVAEK